jgi:hypothetical protein
VAGTIGGPTARMGWYRGTRRGQRGLSRWDPQCRFGNRSRNRRAACFSKGLGCARLGGGSSTLTLACLCLPLWRCDALPRFVAERPREFLHGAVGDFRLLTDGVPTRAAVEGRVGHRGLLSAPKQIGPTCHERAPRTGLGHPGCRADGSDAYFFVGRSTWPPSLFFGFGRPSHEASANRGADCGQ